MSGCASIVLMGNRAKPARTKPKRRKPTKHQVSSAPPKFTLEPRKVALVAVDWRAGEDDDVYRRTDWDEAGFHPLFPDIAKVCDKAGCDTILYAPWTHSVVDHGELTRTEIFGRRTKNLQNIILEQCRSTEHDLVEVWSRGVTDPHRLVQRVSKSSNPKGRKVAMMDALPRRAFGRTTILICGEINMIQTKRDSDAITDEYGFLKALSKTKPQVILNPVHYFMRRHEMRTKRAILSQGKRWLLSVWNRGYNERLRGESYFPWQAYYDGSDLTERVEELAHKLGPDVRIGTIVLTRR